MEELERKNRELLLLKLQEAQRIVNIVIKKKDLKLDDEIHKLLRGIQDIIEDYHGCKYEAKRNRDLKNYFINDVRAEHYTHILRNIIMTIMNQDYLDITGKIRWLKSSIDWRLNSFDDYWRQMEEGIIKNPYLDEEKP